MTKKIMFSDKYGLTQAVLDGRKKQTRRIVKFGDVDTEYIKKDLFPITNNRVEPYLIEKYSNYKVGEIVAIAQSYKQCGDFMDDGTPRWDFIAKIVGTKNKGWTNKMFVKPELMPHQIRITNIRVEKLQDISDEDCLAEGIKEIVSEDGTLRYYVKDWKGDTLLATYTPQKAYSFLIDKVGKKGDWDKNPYVFVYDFELIK